MSTIDEEIARYERESKDHHAVYLEFMELSKWCTDFTDKNYLVQQGNYFFLLFDLKRGFVETLKRLRDGG